jgi:hypothetical protein
MPSPRTVIPRPVRAQAIGHQQGQQAFQPHQASLFTQEEPTAIRALTIRPPWSDLIALEDEAIAKRIENRGWTRSWRGTLLIHGGLTIDQLALTLPAVREALPDDYQPVQGAVVAIADLKGIHRDDGECTLWSEHGSYHWELTNVQRLQPVKARGAQGLWTPKRPLLDQIAAANTGLATRLAA